MEIDTKIMGKDKFFDRGYECKCHNPLVDAGYENTYLSFNSFIELWDGEVVSDIIHLLVCPIKKCHVWNTSLIMPYAINGEIELFSTGQDDVGFSYEHSSLVPKGLKF